MELLGTFIWTLRTLEKHSVNHLYGMYDVVRGMKAPIDRSTVCLNYGSGTIRTKIRE